ncbi:MAG: UDP-2,3-diacylglucosamine diphosphatase, partial [Wenzhouxiangellaceae bacterium]
YLPKIPVSATALLRGASRLRKGQADSAQMDVVDADAEALLRESDARRMIHGHTHRPFRHAHQVDGTSRERIVLGDWYTQGSVLTVSPESIELQSLDRDFSDA